MALSVANDFENYIEQLKMSDDDKDIMIYRYHQITKRINRDYWNSESDIDHSIYVGSHGRGTDIYTSDIDIVVWLPWTIYSKYKEYSGNKQSYLIQDVKNVLKKTYSNSSVRGDGQVIVIDFSDGMKFEIVPAFQYADNTFLYPDTNDGGKWRTMDPRTEIKTFNVINSDCNGNLKNLCKMIREWNKKNYVCMQGILIDTIAYRFLKDYTYKDKSYLYYDYMSRDFFKYLMDNHDQDFWVVPGGNWHVKKKYSFYREAKEAYENSLNAIKAYQNKYEWTYKESWRKIYGSKF